MIRYLLDTNIVIDIIKKRPIEVLLEFKKKNDAFPQQIIIYRDGVGDS